MRTKRFSDQVSLRREARAKSLGNMRSFAPSEAKKFLALNPDQSFPSDADATPTDLYESTPHGSGRANSFFYKSTCSNAALRKARSESAPSADNDMSIRANGVTPLLIPLAPLPTSGTSESVPNTDDNYILLLHQEAMYRQLLFPEVDHWFTALVEAAWDERDRLVLSSEETVQRYWLLSDETKARETISHFRENAEQRMALEERMKTLNMEELVERSNLLQEFLSSATALQSDILSEQICALGANRGCSVAKRVATPMTPRPPSRTDVTPRREGQGPTTPRTERHPVATEPIEEEFPNSQVMTKFLLGSFPQLLQFVVDAEESTRSKMEYRWYAERNALSVQVRHYNDHSVLLRFPHGAKSLVLEDAETAERRMIMSSYYDMLLEACSKIEVLHRRQLIFCDDPERRNQILQIEREEWLYSRRAECAARDAQNMASHEALKKQKLIDFQLEQSLARQRDVFYRAESDERFELQRRAARMFSLLMESALDSRILAAPAQHTFSKRHETITWSPQAYNDVYLAEIRTRSALVKAEQESFNRLQTMEASAFVHTRRNILINDDVEAQLREFDRCIEKARSEMPATCA